MALNMFDKFSATKQSAILLTI